MWRVITKYFTNFKYFINTSNSSFTYTICVSLKISSANIIYYIRLLFLIHSFLCGPPCLSMLYLLKKTKSKKPTTVTFYCLLQKSIWLKLTKLVYLIKQISKLLKLYQNGSSSIHKTRNTFTTEDCFIVVLISYTYSSSIRPDYFSFMNRNFLKFLIYKFSQLYDLLKTT